MSLSLEQVHGIVAEWQSRVVGARVHRVRQRDRGTLLFQLKGGQAPAGLLFCTESRHARLHWLEEWPDRTQWGTSPLADFCKAHVEGLKILEIEAHEQDRIVELRLGRHHDGEDQVRYILVVELIGRWSNLILISGSRVIQESLRHVEEGQRVVKSGVTYEPPPTQPGDAPDDAPKPADGQLINDWATSEYGWREEVDETERLRESITHALDRRAKHLTGIRHKIEMQREEMSRPDRFRELGDILQSNVTRIDDGADMAVVLDLYAEEESEIEIELDPRKSVQDNIEALYKKARKAERTMEATRERLHDVHEEEHRIDLYRERLDGCEDLSALQQLEKDVLGERPKRKKKKAQPRRQSGPRRFLSRDGWLILVGRNERENDELSLYIANGRDWWFHSDGSPGSHVVARVPGKEAAIPQETLIDAATLAAHYSPMKGAPAADVAYTQAKHVTKPKGAKPGLVRLSNRRTIRVKMEPERIERLMQSRPGATESV